MQDKLNKIIQMDCLEYLKSLPDKCVDLVLIDPPYNISHAKWDKWSCQKEYVSWLGSVFLECQRVLKDNGSFYFWHNDFQQIAELQHWIFKNTKFDFKSMISWAKPDFRSLSWRNIKNKNNILLRKYFNTQEYCLYYVLRGNNLKDILNNPNCFTNIKQYLRSEKLKSKKTSKDFVTNRKYTSRLFDFYFGSNKSSWTFPTKENYKTMQEIATGFFQKPYEELRAEYEKLRKEYEELRPTFNIQNGQDYNNVWYSKVDNGRKPNKLHSCEKPQDLLQKIILTSSNENDIVLDCFAGSGSLAQACLETGRNFLCCERDEGYVKQSNDRLENWKKDLLRQDKWLNERGVMDFESDIKEEVKQQSNQNSLF